MHVEVLIRDEVLMDLVDLARNDPEFKRRVRADLEAALNEYGYELTEDELAAVKEFHRRTQGMTDAELACELVGHANTSKMRVP